MPQAVPGSADGHSPIDGGKCNTETLAESGVTAANRFVYKIE